jgi:anthranilate synthase component 1
MDISTTPKVHIQTKVKRHLADTITPVSLYLKVRDHFTVPVLLESNDFSDAENCYSFVGLDEIGSFAVQKGTITYQFPGHKKETAPVEDVTTVPRALKGFLDTFSLEYDGPFKAFNGLFGHVGFEAVQYFDTLEFDLEKRKTDLPDIHFSFHRFIIAINHYKNELHILENLLPGESSRIEQLENLINSQKVAQHKFQLEGEESSNLTDEEFMNLVTAGKKHCQIGDVFQIVFSRQFAQKFKGDDFNVYRVLRSINPSPYLFYFDYSNYKILVLLLNPRWSSAMGSQP